MSNIRNLESETRWLSRRASINSLIQMPDEDFLMIERQIPELRHNVNLVQGNRPLLQIYSDAMRPIEALVKKLEVEKSFF